MITAERIAFFRKRKGLSQAEVAEELDVTRQTISRWEVGESSPSTANLIALSGVLDVSLEALTDPNYVFPEKANQESAKKPEPVAAEVPKEEKRPFERRIVFVVCALSALVLILGIITSIGFYVIGTKLDEGFEKIQKESAIPIEDLEVEEVDISEWEIVPCLPLEEGQVIEGR